MSEPRNTTTRDRAEITIMLRRTREVFVLVGRYGNFFECYGYCESQGYALLTYRAIYG